MRCKNSKTCDHEVEILCPYCGKKNQLEPPIGCCGEVHSEEFCIDENNEIVED